jgi:EAL domain-containing protein (putative c-di-GMP-specific phosphodiesterase class I)
MTSSPLPGISLAPVSRQRTLPRLEVSPDNCGHLFSRFSECLGNAGHVGIVALHFNHARFLPETIDKSVALFMRITGSRLRGKIEGGYKTRAGEFFLLLAPSGTYTEELFRQDIETIRGELGTYCALPHVAQRIISTGGNGRVTPVIEGIFLSNREERTGDSSALFTAFQALLGASALPAAQKTPAQREIEEIIAGELVTPVFQPIFSLNDGEVYGYEALSRITRPATGATTDELFASAADYGLAAPLDMLCRKKALARAREVGISGRIFLNVCPSLFQDSEHERGITAALLDELQLERSLITFELTERTLIEDYDLFHRVLAHYREQGYSIAIDDLGSGYAGLKMLARLEPDYVKLARFLIAGIDASDTKQALVEALVTFCGRIGAKVIAEGIERQEELAFLSSTGVAFGQGYLLARPSPIPFPAGSLPHCSQEFRPFTTLP